MKAFVNIFFSLFSFTILLPTSLSATQLAYDQFSNSKDGYSRDDGLKDQLKVKGKKSSEKTYSFGSSYANTLVTITFQMKWKGGWEDSGKYKDYFKVYFNGTQKINDTFKGDASNYKSYSLDTTTDGNGKLKIKFYANTTSKDEYIVIDDVKITTQSSLPVVNNADDICYDTETTNGFCTGIISVACKITTPFQNLSNSSLSNVEVTLGTSNAFSAFSDCGVDNTSGNCQDASGLSIMSFSAFNKGVNYTVPDFTANSGHSTYNSALFSFLDSPYDWVATYIKDGKRYQGKVQACTSTPQTTFENKLLPFDLINPKETRNIIGNTKIIGNTAECVTPFYYKGSVSYNLPSSLSDLHNAQCDNNLDHNDNNYFVKNIDIDSNSTTKNSSSANVNLPATYKEIAWAGLFWQGHYNDDSVQYYSGGWHYSDDYTQQTSNNNANFNANFVKMKIDNTSYISIQAEKFNYLKRGSTDVVYSAFANVTQQLRDANITTTSNVTIADIVTTEGLEGSLGNYGAWTLVVVYKEDETNPTSKLRNNSVYLGYQQVYNANSTDAKALQIPINDFLLPKRGTIDSQVAVFAAEGEYAYEPDSMKLDGTTLGATNCTTNKDDPSCKTNMFDAKLSPSITRSPSLTNNNGIDIDVFDSSAIMTQKRDSNPTATSYSSIIRLKSSGDLYLPSMVSFTTELYKPRVCYYIDTIQDKNNNVVFKDGAFVSEIQPDTDYTYNIFISNMKKSANDTDIEIANKVQVYMNMKDFTYKSNSTKINNIDGVNTVNQRTYQNLTDTADNDLGEYNSATTSTTWRVGAGATASSGGTLDVAGGFSDTKNISYLSFEGAITAQSNATQINLLDYLEFKASFQTDTITIGEANAQIIVQCQDLNATAGLIGISGAFNVVNNNFSGSKDPILTSTSSAADKALNAIPTQISNKPMHLKLLALGTDNETLTSYTGDVNVSIISTPSYTSDQNTNQALCENATPLTSSQTFTFNNQDSMDIVVNGFPQALSNASFQIKYDNNKTTCSRDVFAIRPDRFLLAPPSTDIELLRSGTNYNFSLTAAQSGNTSPTPGYTVNNAQSIFTNLNADKTVYLPDGTVPTPPLNGTLSLATTTFNITDGLATNALGISFDDVGKVNIKIVDQNWSKVDIDNSDTPADCSANGAYICGDINATFIPHHFNLTNVHLKNNQAHTFTYLSNDLNMSAGFDVTLAAANEANTTTTNFNINAWENPVDVNISLPAIGKTPIKSEISTHAKLTFANGAKTIHYNDTNSSSNLRFNFERNATTPQNPFQVLGANTTLTAYSKYTASSGATATIQGNNVADQNATFLYGRSHAVKQRFTVPTDANYIANIYYEAYCYGAACDTSILPSKLHTDDIRWYRNTTHNATNDGNITSVAEYNSLANVTPQNLTDTGSVATVELHYNGNDGYPYSSTMEINASTWLIYDPNNTVTPRNRFQVEYNKAGTGWSGKRETTTTTKAPATAKTNRRVMW